MTVVERNDVDISKLFIWGKKHEIVIENAEGETVEGVVYMRLLGDADVNRARVYALRKSAELRKKLKDPNSDERIIYIRELEDMTDEDLMNYITMFSMREITNQAYREVKLSRPKMPKSNSSLEKMEAYQKELDEFPAKMEEALHKYIKREVDNLKKALKTESKEALYKKYVDLIINEFCEQEAFRAYRDMEIFLGCYKDEDYKEKFFSSLEQYENLNSEDKQNFRTAYDKLNIPMDELKKLREATQ